MIIDQIENLLEGYLSFRVFNPKTVDVVVVIIIQKESI